MPTHSPAVAVATAAAECRAARAAWVTKARCRSINPDELFVGGAAQRKATLICRHCPVIAECFADALDNQMEFGVWGGQTVRQRRALLKQHPEVVSWSKLFAARQMVALTNK
ncbi:WhiB family transcriptional regulator [Mycobacterium sp. Dal123C01]|uniref:WhiB family transcriptional regulator n=1 Tax=Mycobacterium sp. Dal123C01 TaxID=3457577 RepID=UPI00403ED1B2